MKPKPEVKSLDQFSPLTGTVLSEEETPCVYPHQGEGSPPNRGSGEVTRKWGSREPWNLPLPFLACGRAGDSGAVFLLL